MGACCSAGAYHAMAEERAQSMTVDEAFALLDGADAHGQRGAFIFEVAHARPGVGDEASSSARFMLQLDEESNRTRVTDVSAVDMSKFPTPTASVKYHSAAIFFAEARGEVGATAYLRGWIEVKGDLTAAQGLEPVFEPLTRALAKTPDSAGAKGDAGVSIEEAEALDAESKAALPHPPWYSVHTAAWWRRHFGTDMLVGNWLTLAGVLIWFMDTLLPMVQAGGRGTGLDWANLSAAAGFVSAFGLLAEVSYPENIIAIFDELLASEGAARADAPPPTCMARFLGLFGSNAMAQGMNLMNLSMLPYIVWALSLFVLRGIGSLLGWGVLLGIAAFMPGLALMALSMRDDSMREMARGGPGSRTFAQFAESSSCMRLICCGLCGCGPGSKAFEKHFGNDSRAGMWYFLLFMLPLLPLVVLGVVAAPLSLRAHAGFWEVTLLTAGLGLQLRAQYPEYMNKSICIDGL